MRTSTLLSLALPCLLASVSSADIVSQWSFENTLDDTAPSGLTADGLTDNSTGVSYLPGIVGQAVAFTGGRLTASSSSDLNLAADWTLEAFVWRDLNNLQTSEWERFWTKWGDGGNEYHWAVRGTNGELVPDGLDLFANGVQVFDHDTTSTTVAFEDWVHLALIGDSTAGTIRAYINGVDVGGAAYVAIAATGGTMSFGNFTTSPAGLQFSGYIDEARIHDTAVTQGYLDDRVALLTPSDTDGDGLPDSFEQTIIDSDPLDAVDGLDDVMGTGAVPAITDFDLDGLNDEAEFNEETSPTNPDTDGDGIEDGPEVEGTDNTFDGAPTLPGNSDSDDDGISDGDEVDAGNGFITNPNSSDTDDDLLDDAWETDNGLDPTDDTGDNGTTGDPDGDTLINDEEFFRGTHPNLADTDGDGLNDNVETNFGAGSYIDQNDTGTNPLDPDTDGDGLLDGVEVPGPFVDLNNPGTNPTLADTDGDGFGDKQEITLGTNPTDSNSFPSGTFVVSQWSFEDNLDDTAAGGASTDTLADNSTGLSYLPGVVGNAVALPGGKLTAPDSPDLNLTGSWTLEAFIWRDLNNFGTDEWERFWTKWGEGGNEYHWAVRGFDTELVPNGLDLFANGAQVFDHDTTTQSLPFETWVHVALVGDATAGTIRAYVNGVDVGGAPYVAITPTAGNMNFGNFGGPNTGLQYSGYIDEALIHQGAVDQSYLDGRVALLDSNAPELISISHVFGSGLATVTWTSEASATYALDWTETASWTDDPATWVWFNLDDDILGEADQTSFPDNTMPLDSTFRLYRVRQLSP